MNGGRGGLKKSKAPLTFYPPLWYNISRQREKGLAKTKTKKTTERKRIMKKNCNTISNVLTDMEKTAIGHYSLGAIPLANAISNFSRRIKTAVIPVFILTKVLNYTSDSNEQITWSGAYPTKKAAIKAMREEMFSDLDAAYEGLDEETDGDDIPDFKALVKEAMAIARKNGYGDVPLNFSDCEAIYTIYQSSIKIG